MKKKIFVILLLLSLIAITILFVEFLSSQKIAYGSVANIKLAYYIFVFIFIGFLMTLLTYFYRNKDFKILSKEFNEVNRQLNSTILQLRENNIKFKSILTSITDGVIAVDNNKNIIFINSSAEKIFKMDEEESIDKNLDYIIKDEKAQQVFYELLTKNGEEREYEISGLDHKVMKINSNFIFEDKNSREKLGTIFVIRDITELKKLESIRKDFVANVSHELKTPLTSLKGFIETLKSGAMEDPSVSDKFLNIMDIEVNRMNALVEDLLMLSEIESEKRNVLDEYFHIEEVIDEVFQVLNIKAEKRNIVLSRGIKKGIPAIYGNFNYFKQMILNLTDNAIKYTQNGGKVVVKAQKIRNHVVIDVIDTGIGIAPEDQKRIFERFYRVDKSRSKQMGGTGLGLAIVKHIVLMFKGTITINSKFGEGSIFTVTIPLDGKD